MDKPYYVVRTRIVISFLWSPYALAHLHHCDDLGQNSQVEIEVDTTSQVSSTPSSTSVKHMSGLIQVQGQKFQIIEG